MPKPTLASLPGFLKISGARKLNYLGGTGASWFERTQSHTMLVSGWGWGRGRVELDLILGLVYLYKEKIYIFLG